MRISLIVAMDRNGLIGNDQGLPWKLSADLRRFRKLTLGKPVIMGRKTLDHIGGPLKDRPNIVLTRQENFEHPGCTVAGSLEAALEYAQTIASDEIMIIGGAEVYRQALLLVERIYLTIVEGEFTGNAYFPLEESDRLPLRIVEDLSMPADEKNVHPHRFLVLDRVDGGMTLRQFLV
ncbi:MAG: dihydrofolate reductase [Planctomycetes bacterium]|nr:dihydrofolate reductase [Planctomycetota bacterium]